MQVPQGSRTRSTHWVFTHWCDPAACMNHPHDVTTVRNTKSTYKVLGGGVQAEKSPDEGKHHWQGWCHFDKEILLTSLTGLFCSKIHWEKMLGPTTQSVIYTSKEFNKDGSEARWPGAIPIVFGDITAPNPHIKGGVGARNDLEAVIDLCKEGNSMADIANTCPNEWIKFNKGIRDFMTFCGKEWEEQPREFKILWGDSGSGKDWGAKRIIGEDSYYKPEQNNQSHYSFENYDGQKWIYLEEFQGLGLYLDDLKKMADRYKCTLRGRGCSKQGLHLGVIITSQANPASWYPNASEEDKAALLRRVTGLWHCRQSHWMDQLTGELRENPCPYVSQAQQRLQWNELPTVPERVGDVVLVNGKKRRLNEEFIDLR